MRRNPSTFLVLAAFITLCAAQQHPGPPQPNAQQQQPPVPQQPPARPQHKFGEAVEVHDEEHLKLHLNDRIEIDQMTEEQQKFHYFFMHDTNNDKVIDGIEILKAITHNHDESQGPVLDSPDEEQLIHLIDSVLKDTDLDNDGLISFAEYRAKQGT